MALLKHYGWNQYGGWRIGIRSLDNKRYYYYAHLRKDHPYAYNLTEGTEVQAGEVIGYLGMTGYSTKENVNNINVPHLHFGMQLIFDESQKDGANEIWIDVYQIIEFLQKYKSEVYYNKEMKEYFRKNKGCSIKHPLFFKYYNLLPLLYFLSISYPSKTQFSLLHL